MSEVREIEAAIPRLEALKRDSTPGEWSVNIHHNAMHTAEFRAREPHNGFLLVAAHGRDEDLGLIVTLHATIDAQLGVLRAGRTAERVEADPLPGWAQEALALATPLARAINGAAR